jgi:hypothetical protein
MHSHTPLCINILYTKPPRQHAGRCMNGPAARGGSTAGPGAPAGGVPGGARAAGRPDPARGPSAARGLSPLEINSPGGRRGRSARSLAVVGCHSPGIVRSSLAVIAAILCQNGSVTPGYVGRRGSGRVVVSELQAPIILDRSGAKWVKRITKRQRDWTLRRVRR